MKLARKGLTPSQIGVTLRDSHGIPQVRFVTGNKILRILKSNGACIIDRLLFQTLTHGTTICLVAVHFCCCILFCTCLLFGDRIGTIHPRGPLAPRQKGGGRAQAP